MQPAVQWSGGFSYANNIYVSNLKSIEPKSDQIQITYVIQKSLVYCHLSKVVWICANKDFLNRYPNYFVNKHSKIQLFEQVI